MKNGLRLPHGPRGGADGAKLCRKDTRKQGQGKRETACRAGQQGGTRSKVAIRDTQDEREVNARGESVDRVCRLRV